MNRIKRPVVAFDTVVAKAIGKLPKRLYGFFSLVGLIVRPGLWIVVLLGSAVALVVSGQQQMALAAFIAAIFVPVSTIMKLFFKRDRPVTIYTEAMKIKSYSFPSSHSYSAALACTVVSCIVAVLAASWVPIIPLMLGLIVLVVGVSRVFVGAHYPSDVLGGIALGLGLGIMLFTLIAL